MGTFYAHRGMRSMRLSVLQVKAYMVTGGQRGHRSEDILSRVSGCIQACHEIQVPCLARCDIGSRTRHLLMVVNPWHGGVRLGDGPCRSAPVRVRARLLTVKVTVTVKVTGFRRHGGSASDGPRPR